MSPFRGIGEIRQKGVVCQIVRAGSWKKDQSTKEQMQMEYRRLRIMPAAVLGAVVCMVSGCGGGNNDSNDEFDSLGTRTDRGILTPLAPDSRNSGDGSSPTPVQSSIDTLEQCSGLDLSQEATLLFNEEGIANNVMSDLLAFEFGGVNLGEGSLGNLTRLAEYLVGTHDDRNPGQIRRVLGNVQQVVSDEVAAGRLTPADETNIRNLAKIIPSDLDAGLPDGPAQLASEVNDLAAALQGLSFVNDQSGVKARVFDVIGGALGADGDLLNALINRDISGTGAAYQKFLTGISDLQKDCNGVSSGVLDEPSQTVQNALIDNNLPLLGQLYGALGVQLGSMPFSSVVRSLLNGNFTSLGGMNHVRRTLTEGSLPGGFKELQSNLELLGNLLGPLARLDSGGVAALAQLERPRRNLPGTLPDFTGLLNLVPLKSGTGQSFGLGGTAITPAQAGSLITSLLTPVGGTAPIAGLASALNGGNVQSNLTSLGATIGGIGGVLP